MSFSSSHLVNRIKNSPAILRQRFSQGRISQLSHGDPLFKVQYLGMEHIYSLQVDQTREAVTHLAAGLTGMTGIAEHALVVRPRYLEVKEIATGRQITKTYLRDIACCAADGQKPDIFLYVHKHRGQLQCRAFLCKSAKRAREITDCLAQSFQRAFSERGAILDDKPLSQISGEAGRQEQGDGESEEEVELRPCVEMSDEETETSPPVIHHSVTASATLCSQYAHERETEVQKPHQATGHPTAADSIHPKPSQTS
ncbi:uncharacterized protein LOC115457941 isoform X2 [Microcaecilia unicolor]|uniref:Uncharacterized protein LOC115457941 isoform X2 n=1 Tax=Microcaecilia unicolor TaxID=1415580 RepID=A0A6P7WQU3_9AMPH|nr:uncharacterized protein LOC115457941 isoform X2 [Microcaecilia unicolor]